MSHSLACFNCEMKLISTLNKKPPNQITPTQQSEKIKKNEYISIIITNRNLIAVSSARLEKNLHSSFFLFLYIRDSAA